MGDIIVDVYTEERNTELDANTQRPKPPRVCAQEQTGAYSTFEIAETVTGAPGTLAKAENLGTKTAVKLKLTIPQGKQGERGKTGETGKQGEQGIPGKDGYTPVKGKDYFDGQDGTDGTTFTPNVDEEGNLSWSNTDGKDNPESVNIRGPQGKQGETGRVQGNVDTILAMEQEEYDALPVKSETTLYLIRG